ncbi:SAM-dependent methyltransferase [Candidatus Kaiserbacteria bacterium]|nr:SAM-dependent methyltransferase [Candidatus Kaiserbacteria bacterium]
MKNFKKQKAIPFLSVSEMKRLEPELKEKYQDADTKILSLPAFLAALRHYLKPSTTVLDLGSANGQIFSVLQDLHITDTYGADIGNYLSKGHPKNFALFDFNMDSYPYVDGQFDAVTSIETIEHLENPYHFVREVHRILKKEGIFIFSTPNPNHIFNKITFAFRGSFYRFLEGNDHITFLTDPILKKGILEFFIIEKIVYLLPEMPWRFLNKFTYPANKHFGRSALYVLRNK